MSGFEIAGVVLGAFPILCDASKDLRDRYKDVKTWWQFEREFEDFISDVWQEYIAFSQIIDILVEPLVNLTDEERKTLQNDPQSILWRTSRIQAVLEQRVQPKYYKWFTTQLTNINNEIISLHRLLPIGKAYHLDSTSLESELFRMKTAFSHKKDVHLSKIKEGNRALYEFLDRASYLSRSPTPTTPTRGSNKVVSSILELQEQARCLYKCFQRHWVCTCSPAQSHPCGITVDGLEMKLLFNNGSEKTQVQVAFEAVERPNIPALISESSKPDDIIALQEQISVKNRLRRLKDKGNKGIFGLAASSISVFSTTESLGKGQYEGLQKPQEKLKKKKVSFVAPPAVANTTQVQVHTSTQVSAIPVVPVHIPDTSAAIKNMCVAFKDARQQPVPSFDFMDLSQNSKLVFRFEPPTNAYPDQQTFESYLKSTPQREARLRLGLAMIMTMLKLGPDWLPQIWSKKSLQIVETQDTNSFKINSQPYFYHNSVHETLKSPQITTMTSAQKARASLLALGIVLLELLFRETLEQQPFHAEFLNEGKANEFTDLCAAWSWQKKVEEEFGHKLANAIRLCVTCEFDSPNLEGLAFINAVWSSVAKPVEEFLQAYS